MELEKEAKKVAKQAAQLRKQLKQGGKNSGRRRGRAHISVSVRSVSQSPTRPPYLPMSPHTEMRATIRSRVPEGQISMPSSSSNNLLVEEEGPMPSLIVILKLEHPSRFRHIFRNFFF